MQGWYEAGQIARSEDGSFVKEFGLYDENTRKSSKGFKAGHLGSWDRVSEQVPISRKVTVLAGSIKVNPNLICLLTPSRSTSPYLKF